MLKPAYQVSVLSPSVHPEQEFNQRYRPSVLRKKNQELIWEVDLKPYH